MSFFSFKDLYTFIVPFINGSESFDEVSRNQYCKDIDNKIVELYDIYTRLMKGIENNNIKFIIIYNSIIEILVLKILKINPIEFYYIFEESKVVDFIKHNSISDVFHKPLSDIAIFSRSLKLNILTQVENDDLVIARKIRNNFSISHPFNESIETSYFNKYDKMLKIVKDIKSEFRIYDKNTNLFISKISSNQYRDIDSDVHIIIKEQLNSWKNDNIIHDQLNFCLNKLFSIVDSCFDINNPLFEFILEKIDTPAIGELFFNQIFLCLDKIMSYKLDDIKIIQIYNILLDGQVYFNDSKMYLEIKKNIQNLEKIEGKYYSFCNVNSVLENKNVISYLIKESEQNNDDFAIDFYEWILLGNIAGIAYNISNFEQSAYAYPSFYNKIVGLLNSPYNIEKTKFQYRNEKARYKFYSFNNHEKLSTLVDLDLYTDVKGKL